ncbi:MAG: AAA family ATPase [Candidatus Marinimicrobia bacterium]|nr:AAA family ATPase [Candidatus Neomarinimicrobiota bacterium]
MQSYEYWGLNDYAFKENAGPKFFYKSTYHQEALDRLNYIIESNNMGIGLLTGEIGSGKTMTRNVFIDTVTEDSYEYEFAVLETSDFAFVDILTDIVGQLCNYDVSQLPRTKYKLYNMLKSHIEEKVAIADKKIVIILDEAQKLSSSVLDSLKDLTNIAYKDMSVITIILVGQPELKMNLRNLPQVNQRISLKYHIGHMNLEDTIGYIKFRLKTAGSKKDVFTEKAMKAIFYNTYGSPREINQICRIALDYGYSEELDVISDKDMEIIFNEFS